MSEQPAKREPGDQKNYYLDEQKVWHCRDCHGKLSAVTVYHSVWFEGSLCSGGGDVESELVPYCPNCEEKPNPNGAPIYV